MCAVQHECCVHGATRSFFTILLTLLLSLLNCNCFPEASRSLPLPALTVQVADVLVGGDWFSPEKHLAATRFSEQYSEFSSKSVQLLMGWRRKSRRQMRGSCTLPRVCIVHEESTPKHAQRGFVVCTESTQSCSSKDGPCAIFCFYKCPHLSEQRYLPPPPLAQALPCLST